MKRLLATIAVGLAALTAAGALAIADVGDPPTHHFPLRCPKPIRPCTDPIVIGAGRTFAGPIEIIGFHSRVGFCLGVNDRDGSSTSCGGEPPRDAPITPIGVGTSSRPSQTDIQGFLDPAVSLVRARYFRDGRARKQDAIVAQVDGELLDAVRERKPFGVFVVVVRDCIKPRAFRIVGYDALGRRLDRARLRGFRALCGDGDSGQVVITAPDRVAFQR